MADDSDYDVLIEHLDAASRLAAKLEMQHAHFLLQMVLLEVADTLSRGRLMRLRGAGGANARRNQSGYNRLNRQCCCVGGDAFMSWDIAFPAPIPAPRGKPLATLRETRAYITKLPNKQHDEPAWRTAVECLLLVADKGGPPEFARLALERALRPKGEPVYRPHSTEKR